MVEFVFVAPLLIMLMFAIIIFGLALSVKQDVTRAAAEGARAAAVALPDATGSLAVSEAQTACQEAIDRMFGGADATCDLPSVEYDTEGLAYAVSVTVRYDAENAFIGNQVPFVGAVLPAELVDTSVVRINQP